MLRRYLRLGPAAVLATLTALSCCTRALGFDYQIHGYAAQGLLWSSGNNFFGHSTYGSVDYYEAGLNTSVALRPDLLVSAQGAIRDAGASDTGRPRLDFALLDYRFLENEHGSAGARAGKVKNPAGFFNETRDVVFTRPSILLPAAYTDNQNQRDLIFGAPGGQLYGDRLWGEQDWSFVATISHARQLSEADKRLLITISYAGQSVPLSLQVDHSWNFQIMDSIAGGRWQFAYSHFYGRFILNASLPTAPPLPVFGRFDAALDFFSARFNGEALSLTAEYMLNPNKDFVTLGGIRIPSDDLRVVADSAYLQADYRINPRWGVMARIDSYFRDRNDRSGTDYAAATPGASRYDRFAYDYVAGAHWRSEEHWGVWAEYHWFDGRGTIQPLDNIGRTLANHWSLLAFMAAYTF